MSVLSSGHRLRRGVGLGSLVAAVALLAAVPASAQSPQISSGGGPPFPARTLVLTAPGSPLSASNVHVLENGRPVGGVVVTPLSNARKGDFGVVLAIDTSGSMAGNPIGQAMKAARAVAAGRSANEEVGVVEFSQRTRVVLPITADAGAIDRALSVTPVPHGGTHLFDAVALAVRQLLAAKVGAGAVIVVSDGGDRGSRLSVAAATALGHGAHYAIYTVGVRDPGFDGRSLAAIARDGGGTFVAAAPARLHTILTDLQARLSNRYVVHYRSLQGLGQRVRVSVMIDGVPGAAGLSYSTPVPPPAAGSAAGRAARSTFWTSTLALLIFAVAGALLVGLAAATLLGPRARREGLRSRVGRFTDTAPLAVVAPAGDAPPRRELLDRAERRLQSSPRWQRLSEEFEVAGIQLSPLRAMVLAAAVTVALAIVVAVATGVALLALPVLLVGPLLAQTIFRQRLRHQRKLFTDTLPSHLQEIASAMRAGHSLISGFAVTADGASEPAHSEFGRVIADEQLGMPLHLALAPVVRRMASPDMSQVVLVASLHERTGGNMAEVLDQLAEGARERADLHRELASLTAQARLSRYIVTALPPGVLAIVAVVNPTYVSPLFHTATGQLLLVLATGMVIVASVVMRKIVDIQV